MQYKYADAASSTSPIRPRGFSCAAEENMASRSASLMVFHSGERTTPGATAFTRTGASSTANAVVSAFIAPQRLTASAPNLGCSPADPLVSVMEPPAGRRGPNTRTVLHAPMKRVW